MIDLPVQFLFLTIAGSAISQLLQKKAAIDLQQSNTLSAMLTNVNFLLSGLILGSSLIFWMLVLQTADVSVAYPLLSLNYVVVLVLARLLLNEHIPSRRWVGVLSIIAGVTVLTGGSL